MKIKWHDKPQKHDYPAAESYLRLSMDDVAAKDIFRASGLSVLGISNSHVEKDRDQIIRDEKLSPLLLCRDRTKGKLIIADGYHRLCAVCKFDEDAEIPCKIA